MTPASAISAYTARASAKYVSGVSRDATWYITSRHVQNVPEPTCTVPRSARWKAWLWAFARPGTVRPRSRTADASGAVAPVSVPAPVRTAVIRPSATSRSTSGSTVPFSQAYSAR